MQSWLERTACTGRKNATKKPRLREPRLNEFYCSPNSGLGHFVEEVELAGLEAGIAREHFGLLGDIEVEHLGQ